MEFNERLVQEQGRLLNRAKYLTKQKDTALDLVQDTMLRAIENKDKFQDGANMHAWLQVIMHNHFINGYNKSKSRKTFSVPEVLPYNTEICSNEYEGKSEMDYIKKMVSALPAKFKKPVLLSVEGYSYSEIAKIQDCTTQTARVRVLKAVNSIKNNTKLKDKVKVKRLRIKAVRIKTGMPIIRLSEDMVELNGFDSIHMAAAEFGVSATAIWKAVHGGSMSAGYFWKKQITNK